MFFERAFCARFLFTAIRSISPGSNTTSLDMQVLLICFVFCRALGVSSVLFVSRVYGFLQVFQSFLAGFLLVFFSFQ